MCLCCQRPPDLHTPSQGPPHPLDQGPMDTPASGSSKGWTRQLGGEGPPAPPPSTMLANPSPKEPQSRQHLGFGGLQSRRSEVSQPLSAIHSLLTALGKAHSDHY